MNFKRFFLHLLNPFIFICKLIYLKILKLNFISFTKDLINDGVNFRNPLVLNLPKELQKITLP